MHYHISSEKSDEYGTSLTIEDNNTFKPKLISKGVEETVKCHTKVEFQITPHQCYFLKSK